MAEYNIRYRTGDEIYVGGTIDHVEVIRDEVFYKIREADELIPEGIVFPKRIIAEVNIAKGDFSEIERLEDKIVELNSLCEKARAIMEDLACKEIEVSVKPSILQ